MDRLHFASLAFILPALLTAASAQGVQRFDMGSATSPLAAGYTAVTPATTYSAAAGFGWTAGTPAAFVQTSIPPQIPAVVDPNLLVDCIESYTDLTFAVDVPNGRWQGFVWLGNVGSTFAPTPRENLDVSVNGVPVASDTNVRTLTMKAQFTNSIGGYRRIPFVAATSTGRLDLTFHCNGSGTSKNAVMAVEIWPNVPAPIGFDHGTRDLVAEPAHAAALAPALAAFNADDYAAARTAFAALADPRLKAWGYAWLLGWLTGDEVDVDLALLAESKQLLEGLASPDDVSVAGLLLELRTFELGEFFNRARGYTVGAWPGSLGDIVKNLSAAGLLFDQFAGDVLGSAVGTLPESPLFAKARYLQARNMYGRNTQVNDPANPFTAAFLAAFTDVQNNIDLWPKAAEAKVMGFMATNYAIPGGLVQNWSGPASLPAITPAATWWAGYVASTNNPNAPAWANSQRRYLKAFRNCGEWWMTKRLIAGEIGGGDGDDVEGAGLLGLPSVVVSEPGNPLEAGAALVMDKVLWGPSMTPAEGFFTNCGDVEHSAEYSTNPLYILLFASYGVPKYVEYALRTLRNLDNGFDPVPWTLPDGIGGRHFRSYNMGANVVCGPGLDIPLNMRAAVPGFAIGDYAAHPRVLLMFDELARAWAQHALSTAQGKPAGVFPAAVNPAPPYVFGTGGQWWANAGYVDLAGGPYYHSYLYALLLSAYSHSQAVDRHVFLQPLVQAGIFLHGYRTGTVTGTAPGTGGWTANLLKTVMADALAQARGLMIADPNLALSAADLAKIDVAINAYASPYERHVAIPVVGTKSKASFETTFGKAATWMEYFWVLASTTVSYTDRIYAITGGSHGTLFGSMTGASTWGILPPSVVSWTNPDPSAGELDFAALVNDIQSTGLDILLMNFAGQPRNIGLRLWRRLPAGLYEARIGRDFDQNDVMDAPPHTVVPFTLGNPGVTVVLPNVPFGGLQKVEVRWVAPLGAAPALLPDPGISFDDVAVLPGGAVAVTVHNLGSAPVAGGVVELVENGVVVAQSAVPTINAPLDYQAKMATVNVCCRSGLPGLPLTVRVTLPPGTAQVTPQNDAVTFVPPSWVAYGNGCPGPNGVPALQLVTLPEIGGTFTLAAHNLGGSFAFMVIGFGQISAPLQPIGLGFGAGCTLLVTPDFLEFLPQASGSASWSLAIPPAPGLAGVHLFNQVAEFGAVSTVSNAGDGEIR
ncbi:MAG TPA: hypothetical protein VF384_12585 [Planctomycetota bacterium]